MSSLGVSSGYISVLILALFINSNQLTLKYTAPEFLWLLIPIFIYWISRTWMITYRGNMNDDPIIFAIKDNASRWLGLIGLMIVLVAM